MGGNGSGRKRRKLRADERRYISPDGDYVRIMKTRRGHYRRSDERKFKSKIAALKVGEREFNSRLRYVGKAVAELMEDVKRRQLGEGREGN